MVKTTDAATVEKLKRSRFRQQELKAWRPKTQPRHIIAVCFVVSTAFIAFGALILAKGSDAIETEPVRYDNLASCDAALRKSPCYIDQTDPSDGIPLALKGVPLDPLCGHPARNDPRAGVNNTCTLTLTLTETMQPPIYMYYQLSNVFQNHRRYVSSRLDKQLRGDEGEGWRTLDAYTSDIESKCAAAADTCRSGSTPSNKTDADGRQLFWCNPCGLVARSFFTDRFSLKKLDGSPVSWTQDGIAWESDLQQKFRNTSGDNTFNVRLPEENALVTDPDFVVWMRTAAFSNFRKLYRVITEPMPAGSYVVEVENNYDVAYFEGEKAVLLAEMTSMGRPVPELGVAYIVVGALTLLTGLWTMVKEKIH